MVVARQAATLDALGALAAAQRAAGVTRRGGRRGGPRGARAEPDPGRRGRVLVPQDAQVQPMLATAALLRRARAARRLDPPGPAVTGIDRDAAGEVTGVRTDAADAPAIGAPFVVNAAGTGPARSPRSPGVELPVLPRRGFILVTEPLPRVVRHKVYTAEYVANVAASDAGLQTSSVVEGTRGGTVLIGASRERVGFDRTMSPAGRRAGSRRRRSGCSRSSRTCRCSATYLGFRPYCPDHLPVIGADPRVPGLIHACGHEGAGIGLAAATAELLAQHVTGRRPDLDLAPFRPDRFDDATLAAGIPA